MARSKQGSYTGNTAAQNISLGFVPTKIEVENTTDGDERWTWERGMATASALKIAADGTKTLIASNGITLWDGNSASPKGFTIGTALSESAKTFRYTATATDDY